MKLGDMVLTANLDEGFGVPQWWWCNKIGVIVREAIPDRTRGARCWHVMIDNRTANLREEHLELINEAR
jgi:hypothetical protein